MKNIDTESLLELLIEADPNIEEELSRIGKKFNCTISADVEKHHSLQYTYYYECDFGLGESFYAEIESGINNGSQINSSEWGFDTKENTKHVEVLKDVVFDDGAFDAWYGPSDSRKGSVKRKAKLIFNNNKQRLLDLHRQQSYDNYVTGGGTNKTDRHYKGEFSDMKTKGVFYEYVYEQMEVDRNFI